MRIFFLLLIFSLAFGTANAQIDQLTEEEVNDQDRYIDALTPSLLGEEEASIEKLEKYVSENPTRHAAYFQLARLYRARGQERKCLDAIEKAVTLAPDIEWYLIMQARYHEDYEHWRTAAKVYERLIELKPDHSNYHLSAAHAYLNAGDPKKSLFLLNELENKIGVQPEIAQKKYLIHKSLGQYDQAVEVVQQLSAKFPNKPEYLMILGELYAEMGAQEKERSVYQKVLAMDSSVTEARIRMSELESGSEAELLSQLMPVVKDPGMSIDLKIQKLIPFLRDINAKDSSEVTQLLHALHALVDAHPRDAKAYTMLADGYFNAARLREALAYYEKAEELRANISTVWMQHIQTLSLLDEHTAVLDIAERAFAYFPNQIEFYLQAAEAALALENTEKAREYLESSSFMVGSQEFFKQRFDALAALIAAKDGKEAFPETYIIEQANKEFIVPQSALLLLQHSDVDHQPWLESVQRQATGKMKADFMAQIAAAYAAYSAGDMNEAGKFLDHAEALGAANYPSLYLLRRKLQKEEGDSSGLEQSEHWLKRMGYDLSKEQN